MDTYVGLEQTIKHPTAILSLMKVLFDDEAKISTVKLVSKIIATLAVLPQKFNSIGVLLSALDQYAVLNQQIRFEPIVTKLNHLLKQNKGINSDILQIASNFYILFGQFANYQVNQNIKSRVMISQQLTECSFKETADKELAQICFTYIKQILTNKNDEFTQNMNSGVIDLDSLIDYIEDYYGTTADDSFRKDIFVQQIMTFLTLRKELQTRQQNDEYELELLNEQYDLEDDNQDLTLETVNDKFIQQIEYDDNQIKQTVKEIMFDMSAILNIQNNSDNTLQNVYIFESLKNYTKQMIELKQQCNLTSLEEELQKSKSIYENLQTDKIYENSFQNYLKSMLSEEQLDKIIEEYKYKQHYLIQYYRYKLVPINVYNKCDKNEQENIQLHKTLQEQQQLIEKLQQSTTSTLTESESLSLLKSENEKLKQYIEQLNNQIKELQLDDSNIKQKQQNIQQVPQIKQQQKENTQIPSLIPSFVQQPKTTSSVPNLPPPPSFNNQSSGVPNLPPPPSIDGKKNVSLPPVPQIGGNNQKLPPPPQLGGQSPLPPPSIQIPKPGNSVLPPPPINGVKLPPPSNIKGNLPPLPPGNMNSKQLPISGIPQPSGIQLPKREEINIPDTKLKSFFIDKIKPFEYVDTSIWKQLPNEDIKFTQEQKQSIQEIWKADSTQINEQQQEKPVEQKPKIIMLLEAKKQQALGILMQKFKLSAQDLYNKVLQLQPLTPKEDGISQLLACQISDSDIKLVINSGHDFNILGKPEQFCFLLKDCKEFNKRLQNWMFMKQFKQNSQYSINEIKKVGSFFDLLYNNKETQKLMRLLLSVSNFINYKTTRGNAIGFKCKTLQKYTQKGNNKIELLTNILSVFNTEQALDEALTKMYDQIERNCDILKMQKMQVDEKEQTTHYLKRLIVCYKIAKKTSWQDVKLQADDIIKKYQEVISTVKNIQNDDEKDVYKDYVTKFEQNNKECFEQLQKALEQQIKQIQDTQIYLCEGKTEYQEFLAYWEEFINTLDLYLKRQQKLQQELKMQELQMLTYNKSRHDVLTPSDDDSLQNAQGLMDQLMNNFLKQKRI